MSGVQGHLSTGKAQDSCLDYVVNTKLIKCLCPSRWGWRGKTGAETPSLSGKSPASQNYSLTKFTTISSSGAGVVPSWTHKVIPLWKVVALCKAISLRKVITFTKVIISLWGWHSTDLLHILVCEKESLITVYGGNHACMPLIGQQMPSPRLNRPES